MKILSSNLLFLMFSISVSAQIQKYLSTEQVIVNVDFTQVKGYDKIYLTFNYDNKTITLSNPNKGTSFNFKMISQYKETGTMVGDTRNILVSSTNAPAVKRFFFSSDFANVIFMENKDGKTTTFGGLTSLKN